MAEDTETMSVGVGCDPPAPTNEESPTTEEPKTESEALATSDVSCDIHENGVVLETEDAKVKPTVIAQDSCEASEDARSFGDLDSLVAGDELVAAAGSDSGVEGCGGRALSSGGGSRSCASSVVSCGSGCGSESSSVAGAAPRPRRRLTVTVAEPHKRVAPAAASTPRPVTAPRGPNLATRERARSREKPTPPEKPRPLTPKPRIRPTGELPNLVRESPALRAKPTKTSTARCRTPSSPAEEKRWPAVGAPRLAIAADASATRVAADKYGTLPRRRRDGGDSEGSPKHELTPPSSRRPTIARSSSSRSTTKVRVRIYAEKTSQTVLLGSDVEAALAGLMPNIESRIEVSKCSRGVQANARESETARLSTTVARLEAQLAEERTRRTRVEEQLAEERRARLAAHAELESNSMRLLELAGAGAEAGADACLRALEEQLRAAAELSARQRAESEALRAACDKLHAEACQSREAARLAEARLAEAEREAAEMQDFLAAETGALQDSLRDSDMSLTRATQDLDRSRAECRQLVRMCEQRRQEALSAAARARRAGGAAAALHALDALARRLRSLTAAVARACSLPDDKLEPTVYHNDAYSRSDSGEALTPDSEGPRGGLLAAVTQALRTPPAALDDERSRASDDLDNDNSADLLDSETEPCLVTDPECAEEWWSGAEGAEGAWSGDSPSPPPPPAPLSERASLRNLSAAIAQRQRSEAEDLERGSLLERVLAADSRLTELLRALRLAAAAAAANTDDADSMRLANALRDKTSVTERSVAEVVVKKLAEMEARGSMLQQYRADLQMLKKQLAQSGEEESLELIEEELVGCGEAERRERYEALDGALAALAARPQVLRGWQRLARLHAALERLAFALAAPPPSQQQPPQPEMLHTSA